MIDIKWKIPRDLYERRFMTDKARQMDVPEQYLTNDHFPNYFQMFYELKAKEKHKLGEGYSYYVSDVLREPHYAMCEAFNIDDRQFAELLTYYETNFKDHINTIDEVVKND